MLLFILITLNTPFMPISIFPFLSLFYIGDYRAIRILKHFPALKMLAYTAKDRAEKE